MRPPAQNLTGGRSGTPGARRHVRYGPRSPGRTGCRCRTRRSRAGCVAAGPSRCCTGQSSWGRRPAWRNCRSHPPVPDRLSVKVTVVPAHSGRNSQEATFQLTVEGRLASSTRSTSGWPRPKLPRSFDAAFGGRAGERRPPGGEAGRGGQRVEHTIRVAGGRFAPGHLGELTQIVPFEMVDEAAIAGALLAFTAFHVCHGQALGVGRNLGSSTRLHPTSLISITQPNVAYDQVKHRAGEHPSPIHAIKLQLGEHSLENERCRGATRRANDRTR